MPRLDMTTRQWHELIKPVMPHALNDADEPQLAVVRLEVAADCVYAVATDRHTLAAERLPIGISYGIGPVHIRLSDAAASLKLFGHSKDADPQLRIIVDTVPVPVGQVGRTVTVDHLALTIESEYGTRLVLHDQRDPSRDPLGGWRDRLLGVLARKMPTAAPALTVNAAHVARWAAAVRKGERLALFTGGKGSELILVLVEDHFAAVWAPQSYLEGPDTTSRPR
jgi:hypothetical protein